MPWVPPGLSEWLFAPKGSLEYRFTPAHAPACSCMGQPASRAQQLHPDPAVPLSVPLLPCRVPARVQCWRQSWGVTSCLVAQAL